MDTDAPYFMKALYVIALLALIVLYLDLLHWRA